MKKEILILQSTSTHRPKHYHKSIQDAQIKGFRRAIAKKHGVEADYITIKSLAQESLSQTPSAAEIAAALEKEAKNIRANIKPCDYVICLEIDGKTPCEHMFEKLSGLAKNSAKDRLVFIIGSSHGIANSITRSADYSLGLGRITLNHHVVPAVLLDALSR